MRPRRPRRARKSRVPRSLGLIAPRGSLKTYNYVFKLTPQILSPDLGGVIKVLVPPTSQGAALPIVPVSGVATYAPMAGYAGTIDWGAACTHAVSDIGSFAAYTGIYDAYKLLKVVAEVEFLTNVTTNSTVGPQPTPKGYMIWDSDDKVVPTSVRSMLGRQGVKTFQPTASKTRFTLTYRPMVGAVVNDPAGFVGAMLPQSPVWIDCLNPNVPHYAFKLYMSDWNTPNQQQNALRITFSYHVAFRQPLVVS